MRTQQASVSVTADGVRPLAGVRLVRTVLRTAHLVAFGALYGGHVYDVPRTELHAALGWTVATGAALMGLELYRTPVWLWQIRGLATLVKIALVAAVALWWDARVGLLTLAIVVGGVSSHMPGKYRYYSIKHRRVIGGRESG